MINRPQPVAAIRRLVVLLLCLSSLPGCLTRALWQSETELVTRSELLSESSQRSDGRLGLTSSGVVWRGEDGDETWARLDRPGGDLAMAVLARPGLCEVLKATLERMRVTLDAELVEESAHLALVVRLRKIAIGQVVDAEQLTPEVRGLLASGAMVDERAPPIFRQCALEVSSLDLPWLTSRRENWIIGAVVFVDPAGAPAFRVAADGVAGSDPHLTMRLQELSKLQMLVRLRGLSDSVTLRMRPDLVWLASGVSVQGGQGLCKVEVTLQASGSAEEAEGAPVVPATYEDRLASYQRVTYEEESLSIWAKLAFTPVTLVLDVAFGALWQALVGEEEDDDDDLLDGEPQVSPSGRVRRDNGSGSRRTGASRQSGRSRVRQPQSGGR